MPIYNELSARLQDQEIIASITGNVTSSRIETAYIDPSISRATFSLIANITGINLTLISPSGRNVNASSTDYYEEYVYDNSSYQFYIIQRPEVGEWKLNISSIASAFYATVVTGFSFLRLNTSVENSTNFNSILTEARIYNETALNFAVNSVIIEVTLPNQNVVRGKMYDNGVAPDRQANDRHRYKAGTGRGGIVAVSLWFRGYASLTKMFQNEDRGKLC